VDPRLFGSLEWRCIGPHRGGRVVAVAGHPFEPGTFYFGACAGGVWKTTNAGSHWRNVSDGFFKTSAVGALAVADADPNVIYAGMGEACIRSNVSHGDGVYRSADGGRTWRNVGLVPTRHISRIQVHPLDADVVYVAALGHAWGSNPERGVYRSGDGGGSWDRVLHTSDRAGAADISLDPSNPRVLYAALWEAQRYPHAMTSGGPGSGIWRSLDGAETWTDLTRSRGLPRGTLGRVGVAASPARAGRVWALVEAEDGALFRSDDYGETWERLSDNPELRRRPWYYMHVFADPRNADTVWVLNLNAWKSVDAGNTFAAIPTPHGDNHALWIDPRTPDRMIEGNDGGACVTFDGGRSWSSVLNQATAQFYHVTTDEQVPYHVYGSQQDNWAMRLPSISFEGAISWRDYVEPGGGESGYIAVDPRAPHLVYGGGIGTGYGHGRLIAWHPQTGQKRNITVWPEVHGMGAGAEALKYRFQWTFPVEISSHDAATLYVCSNVVHRSTNGGVSWQVISPDLTRNDPSKLGASGGPITADNSGAEIYCTIFAFRESPHERGVLWAGSDDGLVHLSRDGGQSWDNVTPPELPEWAMVSVCEPSPHEPATAYLAATCYKSDDLRPYLFRTTDYGQTWTAITHGIPDDEFTRVIREDPNRRGLLYCGTETGIYVSFDDGGAWQCLQTNLPVTPIYDLVVKDTDLVVATHGRSFWILDDLTPLYQHPDDLSRAHLFAPRQTVRFRLYGRSGEKKAPGYLHYKTTGPVTVAFTPGEGKNEDFADAGKNPPEGVIIHYWLPEAAPVSLSILDADGREVRSFSSSPLPLGEGQGEGAPGALQQATAEEEVSVETVPEPPKLPAQSGMNRFVWDYRYAGPTALEDRPSPDVRAAQLEAAVPPRAIPGTYQARLIAGGETFGQQLVILPDPRLSVSQDDLRAQLKLKLALRDRLSELHEALNRITRVRRQLEEWERRANSSQVSDATRTLKDELAAIERELMNLDAQKPRPGPSRLKEKLSILSSMIDESDHSPTQGAHEVYALLREQLDEQRQRLARLLDERLPAFSELLQSLGVPPIVA
jgi:photosystem II stability/assembly factor-like uncharacterized protein